MPYTDLTVAGSYPEDVIMLDADDDSSRHSLASGTRSRPENPTSTALIHSPSPDPQPQRPRPRTLSNMSWATIPEPSPPWGAPANGTRTTYPPNFPPPLRTLISLVPLQRPGPLGRNLKPLIISVFAETFTDTQLNCISNLLSLASRDVLKAMAILLAALVRECWVSEQGQELFITEAGQHRYWMHIRDWLEGLEDGAVERAVGWDGMSGRAVWHLLSAHVELVSRPSGEEIIGVRVEMCPGMTESRRGARTLEGVKAFVAALPIVGREEMRAGPEVDGRCCICLEDYYQTSVVGWEIENERPVKLGCGHVVGNDCLERLFGPKAWADMEVDTCPLCRAKVDLGGFVKVSV